MLKTGLSFARRTIVQENCLVMLLSRVATSYGINVDSNSNSVDFRIIRFYMFRFFNASHMLLDNQITTAILAYFIFFLPLFCQKLVLKIYVRPHFTHYRTKVVSRSLSKVYIRSRSLHQFSLLSLWARLDLFLSLGGAYTLHGPRWDSSFMRVL